MIRDGIVIVLYEIMAVKVAAPVLLFVSLYDFAPLLYIMCSRWLRSFHQSHGDILAISAYKHTCSSQ